MIYIPLMHWTRLWFGIPFLAHYAEDNTYLQSVECAQPNLVSMIEVVRTEVLSLVIKLSNIEHAGAQYECEFLFLMM